MSAYLIELVGGLEDGRTFEVSEETIHARFVVLPHADDMPLEPPQSDEVVTFTLVRWEWDGTCNRSGAYRFRAVAL